MAAVLYSADVVCPMSGPPLGDGGVLVAGDRVVAVNQAASLRADADREYHVDGALLPGLVNASTCLEHSDAASLARPGPRAAWQRAVSGLTAEWSHERWSRSAYRGVLSALRSGTTTVGDVVVHGPAVPAASRAGLRGDSWVALDGIDVESVDDVIERVEVTLGLPAEGRRVGLAPSSPARLGSGALQSLAALAKRSEAPLHLACAASSAEVAALQQGVGPLAEQAREQHLAFEWLAGGSGMTPVRYLEKLDALPDGSTLAHGVHVDLPEAQLLARSGVAVVCCPRADELLRAGEAPLEHYAQAGTRLALGSASPAAVGDVDLLAEAPAWARLAAARGLALWPSPAGPVPLEEAAVRLATVDGAAAMGWGSFAGVLEPWRRADLVGLELSTSVGSVYRDVVEQGAGRQVLTVLAGVRKARRAGAEQPWPALDDDAWRVS